MCTCLELNRLPGGWRSRLVIIQVKEKAESMGLERRGWRRDKKKIELFQRRINMKNQECAGQEAEA